MPFDKFIKIKTSCNQGILAEANFALRIGDNLTAILKYLEYSHYIPELSYLNELNMSLARKRGLDNLLACDTQKNKNRAAIFASFSKKGRIEDYVIYYLESLANMVDYIVFVADNDIEAKELSKLDHIIDYSIVGRHGEYDFGSYKRGFFHLYNNLDLESFDQIVISNDSCYGPLKSFDWIFYEMAARESDFWGITQNSEFGTHIQSYFMVFDRKVFLSEAFRQFILSVKAESSVNQVILKYEVGLTHELVKAGFNWGSFIVKDYVNLSGIQKEKNPTLYPISILKQGAQLIKVKATQSNDYNNEGVFKLMDTLASKNRELNNMIKRHALLCHFD